MGDFRQMLTAASQEGPSATRWDRVLMEFLDWLNEQYGTFLRASLTDSAAPRVRHVKLCPRGQRNMQSILLSAYVTEASARVIGQETAVFKTEDDFEKYLAEFVRLPAFHASLETLKELALQSVMGVLRVGVSRHAALLADVTVEVPADEQYRLGDASEATPPRRLEQLRVMQAQPTALGRGRYAPGQNKPNWLLAGGYALHIESDSLAHDGSILLSGEPVTPKALV